MNTDALSLSFCEGGFDLLGRSIDQIRTTKQVSSAMATCHSLNLDGLVIIGGKNHQKVVKWITKSHLKLLMFLNQFAHKCGDYSFPRHGDI
jgi:6-phosphofructokinase